MKRLSSVFLWAILSIVSFARDPLPALAVPIERVRSVVRGAVMLAGDFVAALHRLIIGGDASTENVIGRPQSRSYHARRVSRPDVGGFSPGFSPAL